MGKLMKRAKRSSQSHQRRKAWGEDAAQSRGPQDQGKDFEAIREVPQEGLVERTARSVLHGEPLISDIEQLADSDLSGPRALGLRAQHRLFDWSISNPAALARLGAAQTHSLHGGRPGVARHGCGVTALAQAAAGCSRSCSWVSLQAQRRSASGRHSWRGGVLPHAATRPDPQPPGGADQDRALWCVSSSASALTRVG